MNITVGDSIAYNDLGSLRWRLSHWKISRIPQALHTRMNVLLEGSFRQEAAFLSTCIRAWSSVDLVLRGTELRR
jgi:hypothetical protein